jgi:hypothetical protein
MKLFFRKYGSGRRLLILHGLYGSSDNWVSMAKSISDRFTVTCLIREITGSRLTAISTITDPEERPQ